MLSRVEVIIIAAAAAQVALQIYLHRRLMRRVARYELSIASSFIKSVEVQKKLDEVHDSVRVVTDERQKDANDLRASVTSVHQLIQEVGAKLVPANESKPKDILYIGAAGLGTHNEVLRGAAIEWNRKHFDGDFVVIDDTHSGMEVIKSSIGTTDVPAWQAGSLSVYVAIKDFIESPYERMYFACWNVLRNPEVVLSRRRGMCHASVFSGGYTLTEWERAKKDTAIRLLAGIQHHQWDQVLAHYVCLNKPMARDVIETLDRCKIQPMTGEFWSRIGSQTAASIYSDVLLEAYTMTTDSPEIGNVFDIVSIAHAGQTEGRSWVYFANEACLQMEVWMKERSNDERKS